MAKRFTDTNKYKKPFIRGLQGAYKILWDFLYHDCDHSGIWIVDFEIAQMYVGNELLISKPDALKFFNSDDEVRVIELEGGKKWFLPGFIEFQYGKLAENNRAHTSVISNLKKHNLLNPDLTIKVPKPLTSPLQGGKDKDKEKEMDKEMDKEGETQILEAYSFDQFWEEYGKKRGRADCEKKFNKLPESDKMKIRDTVLYYVRSTPDVQYRKDPETYLNGKHWNDDIYIPPEPLGKIAQAVHANIQAKESLKQQFKNE